MTNIAVLHRLSHVRRRVASAAALERVRGAHLKVHYVDDWEALKHLMLRSAHVVGVIDPYDGPALAQREIRNLSRAFDKLPVIAYADFKNRPAEDIITLSRAGVHRFLTLGVDDDPELLRSALIGAAVRSGLSAAMQPLREQLEPAVRAVFDTFLAQGAAPVHLSELAAELGRSLRSLERDLQSAALPPPRQLLTWCRLIWAAELLRDPGRSANSVALSLGFSDSAALRHSLRRYTGMRPRRPVARRCSFRVSIASSLRDGNEQRPKRVASGPARVAPEHGVISRAVQVAAGCPACPRPGGRSSTIQFEEVRDLRNRHSTSPADRSVLS